MPFAVLPTVFAVHQFLEAAVRPNGVVSAGMAHFAMRAYVFIALPMLPALVPSAVLMLEPRGARLRVAPFAVLGAVVSVYLAVVVLAEPVGVTTCPHALRYRTDVHDGYVWAVLYVVAVLYVQAFASLWCVYAAVLSVLVLVYMVPRRRLPDPHRDYGVAGARSVSNAV